MSSETLTATEHKMVRAVEAMERDLTSIRTGRASTSIVDHIVAEAYGSPMPINQLAGISVPEAHQIVISPWDRGTLQAIEKAIIKSDIGLVPNVDGSVIRLNIPPLTEERRKDLAKQIHKRMEEARIEIRGLRRDAADILKKGEHDGTIGADEARREADQLQRITDKHIADIDRAGAAKEQEIMEV
jgi:ribosome recycling factor